MYTQKTPTTYLITDGIVYFTGLVDAVWSWDIVFAVKTTNYQQAQRLLAMARLMTKPKDAVCLAAVRIAERRPDSERLT